MAVILEKPFHLKYTKIPMWPIVSYKDSDLILLKVKACGICGSDFRYYQGENPWAQHTMGIHLSNPPNIVLGHEYAGTVVAILSENNKKWLGKRVIPICSKVCGKCIYCQTGRTHLCENTVHMGHGQGWGKLPYYPGAYAEYVPAWGKGCYEIPSHLTFAEAAMMDVLAVCVHAYSQANHDSNLPLLILGAGPIGNGLAQVAKNSGVEIANIIIIEKNEVAIQIAKETGFQNIINSTGKGLNELAKNTLDLTKKNVFSVFDCIGTDLSFNLGMQLLDKAGTFVNLAVHDQLVANLNQMQLSSERKLTTSSNFAISDFECAWNWLKEGKFTLNPWLTEISLENVPKIFEETLKDTIHYFKLVILPNSNGTIHSSKISHH